MLKYQYPFLNKNKKLCTLGTQFGSQGILATISPDLRHARPRYIVIKYTETRKTQLVKNSHCMYSLKLHNLFVILKLQSIVIKASWISLIFKLLQYFGWKLKLNMTRTKCNLYVLRAVKYKIWVQFQIYILLNLEKHRSLIRIRPQNF